MRCTSLGILAALTFLPAFAQVSTESLSPDTRGEMIPRYHGPIRDNGAPGNGTTPSSNRSGDAARGHRVGAVGQAPADTPRTTFTLRPRLTSPAARSGPAMLYRRQYFTTPTLTNSSFGSRTKPRGQLFKKPLRLKEPCGRRPSGLLRRPAARRVEASCRCPILAPSL